MTARASLEQALNMAARGWYPVPLLPLTKLPAVSDYYPSATLDTDELTDLWESAQSRTQWLASKHPEYHHIPDDLAAVIRDHHPVWADMEPGIGVILGRSRLAVIDADTPQQVQSWLTLCEEHGYDPGPRTVASPGVINSDGTHKHRDGGHWYFSVPETIPTEALTRVGISIPLGADTASSVMLMSGNRFVVVPPTTRPEGAYVRTEGVRVHPLPAFLTRALHRHATGSRRKKEGGQAVRDDRLWAWDDQTDWLAVLPEGWQRSSAQLGGCAVYAHPDASSDRSAVAHVAGCAHLPGHDGLTPPPMTFFTTTLPDWITEALQTTEGGLTATKIKLYAHKHFGGDIRRARAMLGIQQPATSPRRRASAPTRAVEWTVISRPMPACASAAPSMVTASQVVAAPFEVVREKAERNTPPAASPTQVSPEPTALAASSSVPAEFVDLDPNDDPPVWETPELSERAVEWVRAHAAPCVPEVWDTIERIEKDSGRYAGRDDEPENWTDAHKQLRANRANLLGHTTFRTTELAQELGIAARRARALLRTLIPVLARRGVILRERPSFNPYTFGADACSAEDTAWAAWDLRAQEGSAAA